MPTLEIYLNQEFKTSKPNQVWVSNMTYFIFNDKVFYICVIIDLFSRKTVSHKVGFSDSTQLAKSTFVQVHRERQPNDSLLFHTDRGKNFRSKTFCDCLKSLHVTQSFSRAHVPYDNSAAEAFFASMKREELYRTKYRAEKELRSAIDDFMLFYNSKRLHATLKYRTPNQAEPDYYDKQKACG